MVFIMKITYLSNWDFDTKMSNVHDPFARNSVPQTRFNPSANARNVLCDFMNLLLLPTLIDGRLRKCEYCNGCELRTK